MPHRDTVVSGLPDKDTLYEFLIPTAGLGSRMTTYGAKSLIKLSKKTVIQHQLQIIHKLFKHYKVTVVGGFQAARLKNSLPEYVKFINNIDYEHTNVAHSINLGLQTISGDKIILLYGDLVFNQQMLMAPMFHETLLLLGKMKDEEVGCTIQNKYLQHMCYDLPNKWAQIVFLTGNELKIFREIVSNKRSQQMYGFELINETINRGGVFKTYLPKGSKVVDIDTSKDIEIAKRISL